jgi:hypothetical protein
VATTESKLPLVYDTIADVDYEEHRVTHFLSDIPLVF